MTKDDMIRLAEKVGWHYADGEDGYERLWDFVRLVVANTPPQSSMAWQEGYAAAGKRKWVGLTVQEVGALWDADGTCYIPQKQLQFYAGIWDKLKEKNQ